MAWSVTSLNQALLQREQTSSLCRSGSNSLDSPAQEPEETRVQDGAVARFWAAGRERLC
jgi:hypothetical protein